MSRLTELLLAAEKLRVGMPGFRSIPMDEETAKENGIVGAFEITTGEHAGHMIALKSIELSDNGEVIIDYRSVDKSNEDASADKFPRLGNDVGAIVDYFLIDAAIQGERAAEAIGE